MTWPQPTRQAHDRFCQVEGWARIRDSRGRTGTHHVTYELVLKDGRVLRTRISHPVDRTTYGPSIWSHILRDQLDVTDREFWSCARDGIRPDRGEPVVPAEALPAELVHLLIHRVRLDPAEVAAMTKQQAVERMNRYWAEES
ncbi:hypothetical protein ACFFWC_02735 [Plantactinospora siamensis]|uniref:Cytotoxic translational repressor of toxin-antitoxin stability system n=1 Tax=Plantactinospora siamensis TaxID=555372 RepID=A0ABV6NSH6_9ACTN